MIRGRIGSSVEDLNTLHAVYPWIPDETMIRPNPSILDEKMKYNKLVIDSWYSYRDFILDTHFKYKTGIMNGKRYILNGVYKSEWNFTRSLFPYNLPEDCCHYVLWNSFYEYDNTIDDFIVNNIIRDTLESMIGSDDFDFAWYKNPKPSIPELWHVQVFWIRL